MNIISSVSLGAHLPEYHEALVDNWGQKQSFVAANAGSVEKSTVVRRSSDTFYQEAPTIF